MDKLVCRSGGEISLMRFLLRVVVGGAVVTTIGTGSKAQTTFNDLASYCSAMSEASSPTLLSRSQNIPRAQAEALMAGMTDPASIRMVKEVLDFAYSRPSGTPVDVMRDDLRKMCLAKKIFAP